MTLPVIIQNEVPENLANGKEMEINCCRRDPIVDFLFLKLLFRRLTQVSVRVLNYFGNSSWDGGGGALMVDRELKKPEKMRIRVVSYAKILQELAGSRYMANAEAQARLANQGTEMFGLSGRLGRVASRLGSLTLREK